MASTYFNARGVARPGVPSTPVAGEASNARPVNSTQGNAADAPLRGGIDSFSARDDRPYTNRTERQYPSVQSGAFKPARSAHSSERAAGVHQLSIPEIFEVLRETLTDTEAALLARRKVGV